MALIKFQTHQNFRLRLILATIAGKPIKIEQIRADDLEPGLRDFEVSFLRLLEALTNGTVIEISYTGSSVIYRPGLITGGSYTHKCPTSRAVGYFIEPLLYLAPFSKKPFSVVFHGVTSNGIDLGVDYIRTALFPVIEKFGIRSPELRIVKRGSVPLGGGEVHFKLEHLITTPTTLHAVKTPIINRIRGIAYSTRISPSTVNRLIDAARAELKATGCDTMIYSDVARGDESGLSPGSGITVVAETKDGWCFAAEGISGPGSIPEDLGAKIAKNVLQEVSRGGCVSRGSQLSLVLIFMLLGREDIGRVRISVDAIDEGFVVLCRDVKSLLGQEIILRDTPEEDVNKKEVLMLVKGIGYTNVNKKIA